MRQCSRTSTAEKNHGGYNLYERAANRLKTINKKIEKVFNEAADKAEKQSKIF